MLETASNHTSRHRPLGAAGNNTASMSAPPPPFVEPHPGYAAENKGPEILIITSIMTFLAVLCVASRIYSRFLSIGKLAIDDFVVVFCVVCPLLAPFHWHPSTKFSN